MLSPHIISRSYHIILPIVLHHSFDSYFSFVFFPLTWSHNRSYHINTRNFDGCFPHKHKHENKTRYDGRVTQDCLPSISSRHSCSPASNDTHTHITHTKLAAPSLNFKLWDSKRLVMNVMWWSVKLKSVSAMKDSSHDICPD